MARRMGKNADDQFMGGSVNSQPKHNYNKKKPAKKKAAPPTPRAKPTQKAPPPKPRAKPQHSTTSRKRDKEAMPAPAKKIPRNRTEYQGTPSDFKPRVPAKKKAAPKPQTSNKSAKGNRIDAGLTKRSTKSKPAAKRPAAKRAGGPSTKPAPKKFVNRVREIFGKKPIGKRKRTSVDR